MVLYLVLYRIIASLGSTKMTLTDRQISHAKPAEKDYFLSDERGLRLLVSAKGGKYWRFKYRFDGKQKTLALGVYPGRRL